MFFYGAVAAWCYYFICSKHGKGLTMRALKFVMVSVLLVSVFADAKNAFSSFSVGPALPVSNSSAPTTPLTNFKKLGTGWDAGMTLFGNPLTDDATLSGALIGGKISYSRWLRDSTLTPVTFLGVQGVVRYYTPPVISPFNLFAQTGAGLFIGEYGFADPDTIDGSQPENEIKVTPGKKSLGGHIGFGINWDVVEILPVLTLVFTNKLSAWLSINAAVTF